MGLVMMGTTHQRTILARPIPEILSVSHRVPSPKQGPVPGLPGTWYQHWATERGQAVTLQTLKTTSDEPREVEKWLYNDYNALCFLPAVTSPMFDSPER